MTLNERQHCFIILGVQEGNVAEINILSKILDKIKLTEEEQALIDLKLSNDGQIATWSAPTGHDPMHVDLEDAEANKLKAVLNAWPRFRPTDTAWLSGLIAKL